MADFMDATVDALCDSIRNEPGRWSEDVCTFNDTQTGIEYWIGTSAGSSVTEVWNGHSNKEVFTYEQGRRVLAAINDWRKVRANQAQQRIINSMVKPAEEKRQKGRFRTFIQWASGRAQRTNNNNQD